jgi:hypothetical protein
MYCVITAYRSRELPQTFTTVAGFHCNHRVGIPHLRIVYCFIVNGNSKLNISCSKIAIKNRPKSRMEVYVALQFLNNRNTIKKLVHETEISELRTYPVVHECFGTVENTIGPA